MAERDDAPPRVGIVVLHYRDAEQTRRCLRSLRSLAYEERRVLLVDNDPRDGSGAKLAREFPEVELIESPRNLGYTGGNNLGIRRLLDEGVPYVHVLNNDTEVLNPRFLDELVSALEARPRWGIVGPRVFRNRRGRIERTWLPHLTLPRVLARSLGIEGSRSEPGNGAPREVDVISGVCFLARAEVFRDAGLFDERFFMYGEELDLGARARGAGWASGYVPVDSILHHRGKEPAAFGLAHNLTRANTVRYLRKHRGRVSAVAAALWLGITGTLKALTGAGPGLGAYLRELAAAARGKPACVT